MYRRLRDLRSFDPSLRWDLIYSLPAAFGGTDLRDYLDAAGVELAVAAERNVWRGRFGVRVEQQDSVSRNTDRFLFGEAMEFPPLAATMPGTHAAIEGEIGYTRGIGAFGLGSSTVASLRGEVGAGDFHFGRVQGLLSLRQSLGIFTLAGRLDAGHIIGEAPPQALFRFGSTEGLRGFERNEFGGSTAAVARGRFLVGLPPYTTRPLARAGFFFLPPLQPALVLLGEAGWADVSEESRPALTLLNASPTDDIRASVGVGISFFNDFLTLEYLRPLEADRDARWYFGVVEWF